MQKDVAEFCEILGANCKEKNESELMHCHQCNTPICSGCLIDHINMQTKYGENCDDHIWLPKNIDDVSCPYCRHKFGKEFFNKNKTTKTAISTISDKKIDLTRFITNNVAFHFEMPDMQQLVQLYSYNTGNMFTWNDFETTLIDNDDYHPSFVNPNIVQTYRSNYDRICRQINSNMIPNQLRYDPIQNMTDIEHIIYTRNPINTISNFLNNVNRRYL